MAVYVSLLVVASWTLYTGKNPTMYSINAIQPATAS